MTRESQIESHLCRQVIRLGGEVRKVQWAGRAHAPDRYVMLPGWCFWAELKRPKGRARAGQVREHLRMRKYGVEVYVLDTKEAIDSLLETRFAR